jgi:hypothetical protein
MQVAWPLGLAQLCPVPLWPNKRPRAPREKRRLPRRQLPPAAAERGQLPAATAAAKRRQLPAAPWGVRLVLRNQEGAFYLKLYIRLRMLLSVNNLYCNNSYNFYFSLFSVVLNMTVAKMAVTRTTLMMMMKIMMMKIALMVKGSFTFNCYVRLRMFTYLSNF